uniref:Uncharacterized protein LOC104214945 n=1 Tax=Nicotiana sylvestris TaxID=4096 RepID=A0A1U7VDF8_NICSY|nr:PREDICTED: uncharacterized protein LOC104214945 [Nicotiana sylvestris]
MKYQRTGQDLYSGKVKGIGRERCDLYLFPQNYTKRTTAESKSLAAVKKKVDIDIWPRRLGYASVGAIKQMLGLPQEQCKKALENCVICPLARHVRLPFNNSTSRTFEVFHLLHIDVWVPTVFKLTMEINFF